MECIGLTINHSNQQLLGYISGRVCERQSTFSLSSLTPTVYAGVTDTILLILLFTCTCSTHVHVYMYMCIVYLWISFWVCCMCFVIRYMYIHSVIIHNDTKFQFLIASSQQSHVCVCVCMSAALNYTGLPVISCGYMHMHTLLNVFVHYSVWLSYVQASLVKDLYYINCFLILDHILIPLSFIVALI